MSIKGIIKLCSVNSIAYKKIFVNVLGYFFATSSFNTIWRREAFRESEVFAMQKLSLQGKLSCA